MQKQLPGWDKKPLNAYSELLKSMMGGLLWVSSQQETGMKVSTSGTSGLQW
jgi:hypothetical protein